MACLAVPNWSFYNPSLVAMIPQLLAEFDISLHYAQGDPDHNRTVTAISGPQAQIVASLITLARNWLPHIDMRQHVGVHPRIGALDVVPFVDLSGELPQLLAGTDGFGIYLAGLFGIPTYMYELSKPGAKLPDIRKGGFEGLSGEVLEPDFGPPFVHPWWGASVVGVRRFLIAANINLATDDLDLAKRIAKDLRQQRDADVPGFGGVRALGLPLKSRGIVQVSMNLTLPDESFLDMLYDYVARSAPIHSTELVGVIRERDLEHSTQFEVSPNQVVAV